MAEPGRSPRLNESRPGFHDPHRAMLGLVDFILFKLVDWIF